MNKNPAHRPCTIPFHLRDDNGKLSRLSCPPTLLNRVIQFQKLNNHKSQAAATTILLDEILTLKGL